MRDPLSRIDFALAGMFPSLLLFSVLVRVGYRPELRQRRIGDIAPLHCCFRFTDLEKAKPEGPPVFA